MSDRQTDNHRDRVKSLLNDGAAAQALRELSTAWASKPSPSQAGFVNACLPALEDVLPLSECRVAFLRSFTVEPVLPLLQAAAAFHGIGIQPWVGEFNAYPQEILDPECGLYGFDPHVAILAIQTRDVSPDLWSGFQDLTWDEIKAEIARIGDYFDNLIANFRSHSEASLIVHGLEPPPFPAAGCWTARTGTARSRR
jgi:hypothetical protein